MNAYRRDFLFQLIFAGILPFRSSFGSQIRKEAEINATDASINWPEGLAIDSRDQLYIAEAQGKRVLSLDTNTGRIRVVLGGGRAAVSAGTPATAVQLDRPTAVAIAGTRLWVADYWAHSVIEVDVRDGRIAQVIGGRRPEAHVFDAPNGIAIGPAGEIYVADWSGGSSPPDFRDHGVFRIDPGSRGPSRVTGLNGPIKISPQLLFPRGIGERQALHKFQQSPNTNIFGPRMLAISGTTLYFTESAPWVRAIDLRTREIRIVAGSRTAGYSGDGGPAIKARLGAPFGLAVDGQGNLFISDSQDNRIRKVDAKSGAISTVAGNGLPKHPNMPPA
jgi:sugar lactone lactonase YvrE